jgi:hypothetical protein
MVDIPTNNREFGEKTGRIKHRSIQLIHSFCKFSEMPLERAGGRQDG